MTIQSEADLRGLQAAGRIAAEAREAMRRAVRPGISTAKLDDGAALGVARAGVPVNRVGRIVEDTVKAQGSQ